MSLFDTGRELLKDVALSNYKATITPYVTSETADPDLPNQKVQTQTVGAVSFKGNLYPAGEEAKERAGLDSAVGIYRLISEFVDLEAERKVRISGAVIVPDNSTFVVKRTLEYESQSETFLERL